MAHGKTNLMRNIRKPRPGIVYDHGWIAEAHNPLGIPPTRFWRRHFSSKEGAVRNYSKDLRSPAQFGQYVNLNRDLRKGRRIRKELLS